MFIMQVNIDEFTSSFGDKSSFALQLLAGIYERSERRDKGRVKLYYIY